MNTKFLLHFGEYIVEGSTTEAYLPEKIMNPDGKEEFILDGTADGAPIYRKKENVCKKCA